MLISPRRSIHCCLRGFNEDGWLNKGLKRRLVFIVMTSLFNCSVITTLFIAFLYRQEHRPMDDSVIIASRSTNQGRSKTQDMERGLERYMKEQ
tara:strand:- start:536 stop:814 length:279 start_codon:yes stop_codon:yes gene_type:complete